MSRVCLAAVAWVAWTVLLAAAPPAAARSIRDVHGFEPRFVLPPEANMVSIRDLGAVGDGVTDDTAAFQQAFQNDAPRGIYLPAGTYLVRDALVFGEASGKKKRVCLMGESARSTVLRLADHSPGFGDPASPKVFIATRPPRQQGEQNMHQYLYHLTIEIGKGNAGAIALNYHSNNTGAVKDVVIRAADPVGSPGLVGLSCQDWEVGDAMACYLTVDGFRTGVSLTRVGNYFTLEHVTVRNCETGVLAPTCSIRDLLTENCATPLRSTGLTVVADASLAGSGRAAIVNEKGGLLARQVRTQGYAEAIASSSPAGSAPGPHVAEYVSEKPRFNWPPAPGMAGTLNLPVENSPEVQYPQSADDWAVMPRSGDIADAMQRAIDEGRKVVFIPGGGGPSIGKTVCLRRNVERVMGVGVATVTCRTGDAPVFRLEDGTPDAVILELLYQNYGSACGVGVEQASPRTLVVRHGSLSYRTAPGGHGGRLFMESIVAHAVCTKVRAWMRDMDTEAGGPDALNLTNDGGVLWVLGHKTEDFATKLRTLHGGFTELLGGTYRQNWDAEDFRRTGMDPQRPPPLFEVDGHFSATYTSWGPGIPFADLVRETRGRETRGLSRAASGGAAALFVGYTRRPPQESRP